MRLLLGLATALAVSTPTWASAQVMNPLLPATTGGVIDLTKPFFKKGSEFGAATSVLRPTLAVAMNERRSFVVSVPLVIATADARSSSTTLGNLDVGMAFRNAEGRPLGSLSIILPTAQEWGDDDYATGVGFLSDVLHAERYSSEIWSVQGMYTPTRAIEGGMVGLRVGSSVWIPKGDGDAEVLARYGAFLSKTSGSARLGLELEGAAIVSESDLDAGERTLHEIGGSIGLERDGPIPELFVRFPLDKDIRDVVTASVGLRLIF